MIAAEPDTDHSGSGIGGAMRRLCRAASGPCMRSRCDCAPIASARKRTQLRCGRPRRPDDIAIVQALADVAAIGLLPERAITRSEILTEQLQGARKRRVIIEQAKGVVAQARNISVSQAFEEIRTYARLNQRRLSGVAETVVVDLDSLPTLGQR